MAKLHATRMLGVALSMLVTLAAGPASALPEEVSTRSVEIWSDGTQLAGDLFWPTSWQQGEKLPAIVLCHGWGGTKDHLNRAYAPQFAERGYFVLTFDYRGWGESDGRLVAVGEIPPPDAEGIVTVAAREIRQLVSPVERVEDIRSAISWLELEPGVDRQRIGLWGTSFGGGNIVAVAATDRRVKAIVSQVGDLNTRWGWLSATEALLAALPKAEGSAEALARRYDEVVERLGKRARRIELLLGDQDIVLSRSGLLAVTGEIGDEDRKLVDEQNHDLGVFYSILATTPERADEVYLIHRAWRARGLVDPFPQGVGYGTLPPMSGIADLTQMLEYAAVEMADRVESPVLVIEAGKEELMDPAFGTALLAKRLGERGVPVEREVFEGVSHFEIYQPPALDRARALAIDWFDTHLAGGHPAGERAAVLHTLDAMGEAYAARDLDRYMEYVSASFRSRHHFDRAGYRAYLEQDWQELEWSSSYDPGGPVIEGQTAYVMGWASSAMGKFRVRTNLVKEADGVWRVVGER